MVINTNISAQNAATLLQQIQHQLEPVARASVLRVRRSLRPPTTAPVLLSQ